MPDTTETASTPVLELNGARATIRLNRPKHLNRLQPEDLAALVKLFDRIEADTATRVLVLTRAGEPRGMASRRAGHDRVRHGELHRPRDCQAQLRRWRLG